jgi:cell wall-associated NlpC family hydrolase
MIVLVAIMAAVVFWGCATTKTASVSPLVRTIVTTAHNLVGTRYCAAGTTPDCFDCSGFTCWVFQQSGITLPRSSEEQFTAGMAVGRDQLQPGDLVFFRTNGTKVSHVGVMVTDAEFVHASTSRGVMRSPLTDQYWAPRYKGARRIVQ